MKRYLVFTEYDPEDLDVLRKADAVYQAERAMHPEKYPKYAITASVLGADLPKLTERVRFVDVWDADDPEQMMNNMAYWSAQMPEIKSYKRWYIPLQEYSDTYAAELFHQRKLIEERKEQSKTTR